MHEQLPFIDSTEVVVYSTPNQTANLLCPVCCGVLSQPVELACGNLVCANCCCKWIEVSEDVSCPCCYHHQLDNLRVGLPSAVVYDLLGAMKVSCSSCHRITTAQHYRSTEIVTAGGIMRFPHPLESVPETFFRGP